MTFFSAIRGLWWVASEVVDAAKQLVAFTPGQDDYRAHLADVLAEKEAGEEVAEPQGGYFGVTFAEPREDCGLGRYAERNEKLGPYESPECFAEAQNDCGLGGESVATLPTLIRLWADGYQSDPITAFVDDWDNGRFTITPAHPFSEFVTTFPIPQAPLTVYSTDELEWVVDTVTTDRTSYGPEYTVTCKPRMDVLRKSLISDDYLCWLWLDAEKRYAESASAVPGVAPVEAADKDPGVSHSPTPGSQTSLTAGRIAHIREMCQNAIVGDSNVYPHNPLALTDRAWLAQSVLNILDGNIDAQIIAENKAATLGNDLASVHDRAMRQRHNENREQ